MTFDKSILEKINKTIKDNLSSQKNLEKIVFNLNEFNINLCNAIFGNNEELIHRILEKTGDIYISIPIISGGNSKCEIEIEYSHTTYVQKIYINYKRYVYTFYFAISASDDSIVPNDINLNNFVVENDKTYYKSSYDSEMKIPVNILKEIMIIFSDTTSQFSEK